MACVRRSDGAGAVARTAGAGGARRADADAVLRAPPAEPHHPRRDAAAAHATRAREDADEADDVAARGAALRVGRGVAGAHRSNRRREPDLRSDQTRRRRLAGRLLENLGRRGRTDARKPTREVVVAVRPGCLQVPADGNGDVVVVVVLVMTDRDVRLADESVDQRIATRERVAPGVIDQNDWHALPPQPCEHTILVA